MKPTTQTYRALRIWTFLDFFKYIIFFISSILLSGIIMYVALTAPDAPFWMRFFFAPLFALFWSFYVGLYPLVIYWNYYRHDKHVSLTINKRDNVIIYKNKEVVKEIKMEEIVRLEQYFSDTRMLSFFYYYKIIIKDALPITVTCLLNVNLKKELNNTFCSRILERYLWLLKRDD